MRCPYCIVTLLRLIIYQVVIAVLCVLASIVDNEPQTTENIIYTYRHITYIIDLSLRYAVSQPMSYLSHGRELPSS